MELKVLKNFYLKYVLQFIKRMSCKFGVNKISLHIFRLQCWLALFIYVKLRLNITIMPKPALHEQLRISWVAVNIIY